MRSLWLVEAARLSMLPNVDQHVSKTQIVGDEEYLRLQWIRLAVADNVVAVDEVKPQGGT